ncbi:rhodanese [archaeon]|jgi:rhodanese-related sulfurtransferase|nr:rhodanese [archaeon]MBT6820918.1 rhodanese [archaeon]MBT7392326.1 rhodanese [archaeon]
MDDFNINVKDIKKRIDNEENIVLLDVRTDREREFAIIKNSKFIELNELQEKFIELDKTKNIIVYCHSGIRSTFATRFLISKGFIAFNMLGGIDEWSRSIDKTIPRY